MLELSISSDVERLRRDFRQWISHNKPPQLKDRSSLSAFIEAGRKWQLTLSSGKWVGLHWPSEYGGRSLSLVEEAVIQEELARFKSPQLLGLFGLTMVGPVLIKHGTVSQKERFLSKILSAEEIWCQGFSEPGAGSDLAAVKTKATVSEQGFIVNGQKIWTSFAQIADWCFLLCRTSQGAKKHLGLSYLLVDMKSPGIKTRPLKQISGDEEFNEVFFDDVFVPKENIVGEIGDGWKIAISTLMYERVVLTFARMLQSEAALKELLAKDRKKSDLKLRDELCRLIAQSCAVRALAYEHLLSYSSGAVPGPEGSMDKLFWSETFQAIAKLALKYNGRDALLSENDASNLEMHSYLYSRGRTIAAGTSEIQRNIIAERILGLPRL